MSWPCRSWCCGRACCWWRATLSGRRHSWRSRSWCCGPISTAASCSGWRLPPSSPALEMWVLGLLFVGYATGLRLSLTRLVLLLGLVHMTLQHARHGDLLAIVGPLALAAPLGRRLAALTAAQAPSRLTRWFAQLA